MATVKRRAVDNENPACSNAWLASDLNRILSHSTAFDRILSHLTAHRRILSHSTVFRLTATFECDRMRFLALIVLGKMCICNANAAG